MDQRIANAVGWCLKKLHLPTKTILSKLLEDHVPHTISFMYLSVDNVVSAMLADPLAT